MLWLVDGDRQYVGDEVVLNSFIISNTPYSEVSHWGYSKDEFEYRHVLFQEEDRDSCIGAMLKRILYNDWDQDNTIS